MTQKSKTYDLNSIARLSCTYELNSGYLKTTRKYVMKKLLWTLCLLSIVGCASYNPVLVDIHKKQATTLRVVSLVPKSHFILEYNSQFMGTALFGLLGAFVDGAVNGIEANMVAAELESLVANISDLDLRSTLSHEFEANLGELSWATVNHFEQIESLDELNITETVKTMPEDMLVVIASTFHIPRWLGLLEINSRVSLYSANTTVQSVSDQSNETSVGFSKLGGGMFCAQSEIIYGTPELLRQQVATQSNSSSEEGSIMDRARAKRLELWTVSKGQNLKNEIRELSEEMGSLLKAALNEKTEINHFNHETKDLNVTDSTANKSVIVQGYQLPNSNSNDSEYYIVKSADYPLANYYSIPKNGQIFLRYY